MHAGRLNTIRSPSSLLLHEHQLRIGHTCWHAPTAYATTSPMHLRLHCAEIICLSAELSCTRQTLECSFIWASRVDKSQVTRVMSPLCGVQWACKCQGVKAHGMHLCRHDQESFAGRGKHGAHAACWTLSTKYGVHMRASWPSIIDASRAQLQALTWQLTELVGTWAVPCMCGHIIMANMQCMRV